MSMYEVFCGAISEKGLVWTLIESFSFRNNNEFADKAFHKEYRVNQDTFSWNKFRLSCLLMNAIANRSTHVRAKCNFNTEELKYSDYLRAKLIDIDVMRLSFDGCKKYEFISVRGYNCTNCTAHFAQRDFWHAHTDSYYGPRKGCHCTRLFAGSVKLPGSEDNFGWYEKLICFTFVYRVMIRQLSGGLECVTKKMAFWLRTSQSDILGTNIFFCINLIIV